MCLDLKTFGMISYSFPMDKLEKQGQDKCTVIPMYNCRAGNTFMMDVEFLNASICFNQKCLRIKYSDSTFRKTFGSSLKSTKNKKKNTKNFPTMNQVLFCFSLNSLSALKDKCCYLSDT